MFLIVKHNDNTIIGNAIKPINEEIASKNGYLIFEVPDAEFNVNMLGSKLDDYDNWE